jgi:hypothetical protein
VRVGAGAGRPGAGLAATYDRWVPLALGQRLLLHRLAPGHGVVAILVVVVGVLLMRFWPLILRWWQRR